MKRRQNTARFLLNSAITRDLEWPWGSLQLLHNFPDAPSQKLQNNTDIVRDRQRDRQTDTETDWPTDRQTDRQRGRQTDIQRGRQTGRLTYRQIDRHTVKEADRQTDTEFNASHRRLTARRCYVHKTGFRENCKDTKVVCLVMWTDDIRAFDTSTYYDY